MTTFAATASILSEHELGQFVLTQYDLNEQLSCKLFRTGVNHTYFIAGNETSYVLRLYCYQWRSRAEIEEELRLLLLLKANQLAVSFPIPDKNGALIQEINAPEGLRYAVLFSFAKGEKMRHLSKENCHKLGALMARFHNLTANEQLNRVTYTSEVLLDQSYDKIKRFFPVHLEEMQHIKTINEKIAKRFHTYDQQQNQKGIVHLDIWYDNFSVAENNEITLFDFDNCGKGWLILDVGYFCKQLFFIEADKNDYEEKVSHFLNGYREVRALPNHELELIPAAGASIFVFYLGVQAQRFDWSNVFFTKNYLNMMVGRTQSWMDYYEAKGKG
jgi:Ser/Thr protein kinase RdoA (MazF antagonist)